MRYGKALAVISALAGLALAAAGCIAGKNPAAGMGDVTISAETVPEGIRVTFSNYSAIPPDIDTLKISFHDLSNEVEPDWEAMGWIETFTYLHDYSRISHTDNIIEQVRKTGEVIFPFAQPGHTYTIAAIFINSEDFEGGEEAVLENRVVKSIDIECTAESGINFNKDISIALNNARTGVVLSGRPEFTPDVQFELQKMSYHIVSCTDDYWSAVGSGFTDDLVWEFEPEFSEQLKENGFAHGEYPAYVGVNLNIIHDSVLWIVEVTRSPVFTYSL